MKTAFFFAGQNNTPSTTGTIVVDGTIVHLRVDVREGPYAGMNGDVLPAPDEMLVGTLCIDRFREPLVRLALFDPENYPEDAKIADDFEGTSEDPDNFIDLTDRLIATVFDAVKKFKFTDADEKQEFLRYMRDRLCTTVEQALE